jgi:plastocyanin
MSVLRFLTVPLALAGMAPVAKAQATHTITLEVDASKERYQFSPARVEAAPGDVVLFKVTSGAPHGVVFDAKGLTPAARNALNAAMPKRSADLTSPVLTKNGAEYRVVLPNLPPGTYGYYCLPHRAYDMRGEIVVLKKGSKK